MYSVSEVESMERKTPALKDGETGVNTFISYSTYMRGLIMIILDR